METKVCKQCNTEKSLNEYYFRKDSGKYRDKCKTCITEARKKYWLENIEKCKGRSKKYRESHKEEIAARNKKWCEENPFHHRGEARKKWTAKNKERIKTQRKGHYEQNKDRINGLKKEWYQANKDSHRVRQRKYDKENREKLLAARRIWENDRLKNDPSFRISKNVRRRITMSIQAGCSGKRTCELIGCSIPELKTHLESLFKEGMSWENYGEWHIDHKIPLSWFNLEHEPCLRSALSYKNLQPLWAKENIIKNNKRACITPFQEVQ